MDKELREFCGKMIRYKWVKRCIETGDTKPSHLVPWEELNENDKEMDRILGETLYIFGRYNIEDGDDPFDRPFNEEDSKILMDALKELPKGKSPKVYTKNAYWKDGKYIIPDFPDSLIKKKGNENDQ
jgi:hypothetical protein